MIFHAKVGKGGINLHINSLHASSDFCCRLITFANSLDPDQDRHSGSKQCDALKEFCEKLILIKVSGRQQQHRKITEHTKS